MAKIIEVGTSPGSAEGPSISLTYYTAFLEMIAPDLKTEIYGGQYPAAFRAGYSFTSRRYFAASSGTVGFI